MGQYLRMVITITLLNTVLAGPFGTFGIIPSYLSIASPFLKTPILPALGGFNGLGINCLYLPLGNPFIGTGRVGGLLNPLIGGNIYGVLGGSNSLGHLGLLRGGLGGQPRGALHGGMNGQPTGGIVVGFNGLEIGGVIRRWDGTQVALDGNRNFLGNIITDPSGRPVVIGPGGNIIGNVVNKNRPNIKSFRMIDNRNPFGGGGLGPGGAGQLPGRGDAAFTGGRVVG